MYGWVSFRIWWRDFAGVGLWALLAYSLWYGIPAWSAHLGGGNAGTWTVTQFDCGKGSCDPIGRFVSDSGADIRPEVVRTEVRGSVKIGDSLRAVDSGADRVFPPGGGSTWWKVTILGVFAALGCLVWTLTVPVAALQRRQRARSLVAGWRSTAGSSTGSTG